MSRPNCRDFGIESVSSPKELNQTSISPRDLQGVTRTRSTQRYSSDLGKPWIKSSRFNILNTAYPEMSVPIYVDGTRSKRLLIICTTLLHIRSLICAACTVEHRAILVSQGRKRL